ncbi:MAG: YbjN domain-containing protein [Corynebacterium sp.]|uniref:YbjN domain-containing protein n=1 Tax=Corynebacterium sp. TaxID=1720 RepID=UPI0026DB0BF3|nr:YbjN domain-containing protein [Corynebacterium sp.]MDO5097789.1 YbjN domain-containing protein [Corynebacterium sp.]
MSAKNVAEKLTVCGFALPDVAEVLAAEGLEFLDEGDRIVTGFVDQAVFFQVKGDFLVVCSVWRGTVPVAKATRLLSLCYDWNTMHDAPTLQFEETGSGSLELRCRRSLRVGDGVSFNQLGAFVITTLDAFMACWNYVAGELPYYVNWPLPGVNGVS